MHKSKYVDYNLFIRTARPKRLQIVPAMSCPKIIVTNYSLLTAVSVNIYFLNRKKNVAISIRLVHVSWVLITRISCTPYKIRRVRRVHLVLQQRTYTKCTRLGGGAIKPVDDDKSHGPGLSRCCWITVVSELRRVVRRVWKRSWPPWRVVRFDRALMGRARPRQIRINGTVPSISTPRRLRGRGKGRNTVLIARPTRGLAHRRALEVAVNGDEYVCRSANVLSAAVTKSNRFHPD